ncbi:MAG: polymer-forming cytoskeletal protein, partial [Bacteroidales bacterium]|nr:polymer-forming cytoskeletal protein [Bacteroidales bacterium]
MAKNEEEINSTAVNIISTRTLFEGKFKSTGSLRIDGSFKGELEVGSKLVIGVHGKVEGQVICRSAEVEGQMEVSSLSVSEGLS